VEVWDAVCAQQTGSEYRNRSVPRRDVIRIVDAARRAPSSDNGQPWRFVAINAKQQLATLANIEPRVEGVASAAVAICLTCPVSRDASGMLGTYFDLGHAAMSLRLAATDLRLASAVTRVREHLTVAQFLGLGVGWFCPFVVAVGYPAIPLVIAANPDRRPIDDVLDWLPDDGE
jgi:nitroreductase